MIIARDKKNKMPFMHMGGIILCHLLFFIASCIVLYNISNVERWSSITNHQTQNMSFSIIETGGKQYKVSAGTKVKVEKLEGEAGASVVFDKVLLTADGENVTVGKPYVAAAKVEAKIVQQGRGDKVIVFKYHSKTRYRKKKGHRQDFTEVEIVKI